MHHRNTYVAEMSLKFISNAYLFRNALVYLTLAEIMVVWQAFQSLNCEEILELCSAALKRLEISSDVMFSDSTDRALPEFVISQEMQLTSLTVLWDTSGMDLHNLLRSSPMLTLRSFKAYRRDTVYNSLVTIENVDMFNYRRRISTNDLVTKETEMFLSIYCPNIDTLRILLGSEKLYIEVAKAYPKMKDLYVQLCCDWFTSAATIEEVSLRCPELKRLGIDGSHITDEALGRVLERLTQLNCLTLCRCPKLTSVCLNHIAAHPLCELEFHAFLGYVDDLKDPDDIEFRDDKDPTITAVFQFLCTASNLKSFTTDVFEMCPFSIERMVVLRALGWERKTGAYYFDMTRS